MVSSGLRPCIVVLRLFCCCLQVGSVVSSGRQQRLRENHAVQEVGAMRQQVDRLLPGRFTY